jgi:hypothetical protein
MYLLYLDDAGSPGNAAEAYFVLGGVCVFEAQVDWFSRELDKLAAPYNAAAPEDIEFHASEVFSRRVAPWNKLSCDEARGTLKSVLQVVNNSYNTTCLLCLRDREESISWPRSGRNGIRRSVQEIRSLSHTPEISGRHPARDDYSRQDDT